jgi:hypothetical protein
MSLCVDTLRDQICLIDNMLLRIIRRPSIFYFAPSFFIPLISYFLSLLPLSYFMFISFVPPLFLLVSPFFFRFLLSLFHYSFVSAFVALLLFSYSYFILCFSFPESLHSFGVRFKLEQKCACLWLPNSRVNLKPPYRTALAFETVGDFSFPQFPRILLMLFPHLQKFPVPDI